ncbi:glycosyltransferase family 4 protein [uncultured Thiohalocapsa sp.]|uniref:glycosyltransferase family 4 protein n=1 Tax=uncultured Thiohalocapsa sp. TaxID=768990 RepID=UPI0025D77C2C|nr:glycosyltransferase family 4 protein [uncultured Thiohalocapsa sp.]
MSHYFPPEVNAPASRTYEHCVEWVRSGHEVTVVTCAPNHPRGVLYEGYRNRWFQTEEMDGIHVIRLWTYLSANEGFLRRTLNYVSYMFAAIVATPRLPKPDIVISTSPQFFNGLAGWFVSRLKRVPWALEIRDLWPESIVTVGAIKNPLIIRALERLELFAYHNADVIVPVTDAFKRYMIGKGIDARKMSVLKNGVNLRLFQERDPATPEAQALARQLGAEGRFIAAYVGTHGMAHHLETILEAAALMDNDDILFVMVGDGAERDRLAAKRSEMGLNNVVMLDQLPKASMPALWSLTDVSLVLLKKSDLFKTVIPSKIFESMAMRVPIILGVEGEAQTIIEQAGAGICIEPENAERLAESVRMLYEDGALAQRLGGSGRRYVQQHFDRAVLADRYQRVLLDTIALARTRTQSGGVGTAGH